MAQLNKNKKYFTHVNETVGESGKEISDGLKLLNKIKKPIVTVFGAHAVSEKSKTYIDCEKTAHLLGKNNYAIITGGGPGIMQAANSGAMRAKTLSIGFKAKLIAREQYVDSTHFTHQYAFKFLFARRFCLAIKSDVLIFFPGGYGTLNELFEYVTLIQIQMADSVPVICYDKKYWKGLFEWLKKDTLKRGFITEKHLKDIHFADTPEEVLKIVKEFKRKR